MVPDSSPWFTKPWVNLVSWRRGVLAAVGYTFVGICLLAVAVVGGSFPLFRWLEAVAGMIFVGFAITIVATLQWRRTHRIAAP